MRPGVNVTTRESAPPSTVPTDVGTGIMVGITEAGPAVPTVPDVVTNMDVLEASYFPNQRTYIPGNLVFDSAGEFFGEGGNRLYIVPVFGPAAVAASVIVKDGTAANLFTVHSRSVGDFGNTLNFDVIDHAADATVPSGSFRVEVKTDAGEVLERSPVFVDTTSAVAWFNSNSSYFTIDTVLLATDPAAGNNALVGGDSDIDGITDAQWQSAFDGIPSDLGPAILMAPGVTTDSIHAMAATAAGATGRVAFLDAPDTGVAATLEASAAAVLDGATRARFAALFAPWLVVPGLTPGTTLTVPPSGAVAGRFARSMAEGHTANEPAAGDNGVLRTALDLTQVYSDGDRQDLNAAGINVVRAVFGPIKVYGWRTTANPTTDPRWVNLGNSLMHRQIVALGAAVGEGFVFRQIDGQGHLLSEFNGALVGSVCLPMFLAGALYGATPQDAFKVDTGDSVNTPDTIANNELHAVISVKMSPFAEEVDIEIVKYLVTETIPA